MHQGLNRVTLIGRLAGDPETRRAPSGVVVATFVLTVPRSWTGPEGQPQSAIDSFNVVAWGELAERCDQTLSGGDQAYVEGRLQVRGWTDSEGRQHQQTEIVAAQVLSLDTPA
ncbi:MAG: single-stranded DNA-binding protein [Ardenticatenia bacterium]|nr:single-stranded DNA-binding protein [Ardenticatenia bacterium]